MRKYNRKDNDGHKFSIPTDQLTEFDDLFNRYCDAKQFTDEYYELEAEFCNKFCQYMVG